MPVYDLEPIEENVMPAQEKGAESAGGVESGAEQIGVPEGALEQQPEVAKENSYEKILEQAKLQTQGTIAQGRSSVSGDVSALSAIDEESRIQRLVSIAMEKGPEHAFRVAIELDDMYALDMLHDRLSHQLYQELITKGLLRAE